MESVEKKALYNSLRSHAQGDPTLITEPWQVENYRALSFDDLFGRLHALSIFLDKQSFRSYAEECDSPENLAEYLTQERSLSPETEDQIYLLLFELWRRLYTEKPSLSILCDELDFQIDKYNEGSSDPSALQDAIANYFSILDENVDTGMDPKEALKSLSAFCANDVEMFLYDFITDQIEMENEVYAQELIEDFQEFCEDDKWFSLLHVHLLSHFNDRSAPRKLAQLIENHLHEQDIEFNLEILYLLVRTENHAQFIEVLQAAFPLLTSEEDLQYVLTICRDYARHADKKEMEDSTEALLSSRSAIPLERSLKKNDPDLIFLSNLINVD